MFTTPDLRTLTLMLAGAMASAFLGGLFMGFVLGRLTG